MAKSTISDDPVSEQDKFMLRLPAGMRDRIKHASDLNNRSMNGEIVERLKYSFGGLDADFQELYDKISDLEAEKAALEAKVNYLTIANQALEQELLSSQRVVAGVGELTFERFTDENTIYVLLDADGHPLCWDEIMTHLRAIADAVDGDIEHIEAAVIDPVRVSNSVREKEWLRLREYYRAKLAEKG